MTSAPPKAIKAFVTGTIKEKLLDNADIDFSGKNNSNVLTPFLALLKMELVQRGVLVSLNDNDISKWDVTKTIDAVRNTIGKSLIEPGSGSLPTPLLVACTIMAGRTAELCATVVCASRGGSSSSSKEQPVILLLDDVQSALQRCKEIEDPRFEAILRLVSCSESNNNNKKETDEKKEEDYSSIQISSLRLIAEGYYLRGTSIQPDMPQLWKKSYDVIMLRHGICQQQQQQDKNNEDDAVVNTPGEAAIVLSNMSRIANSKGNLSKAASLSVKATAGYLQLASSPSSSSSTAPSNNTTKAVAEAFVTPYKTSIQNPLKEAEASLAFSLQHQQQVLGPADSFVGKILKVQLDLVKEDSKIEKEIQHQNQLAQNRANNKPTKGIKGSSSNVKTTTSNNNNNNRTPPSLLATIREKVRDEILVEAEDATKILQQGSAAATLREAFLEGQYGGTTTVQTRQRAATVLTRLLERSRDRARALARQQSSNNGWSALAEYVIPFLLKSHQHQSKDSITFLETCSEEEVTLLETLATLVPCLQWMNESSHAANIARVVPIESVTDTLQLLLDRAKQDYQASSNALKTSTEPRDIKIRQLQSAHASMKAWSNILQIWDNDNNNNNTENWKDHTELTTTMAQNAAKFQVFSAQYGTSFNNLLVAWSGFCQPPYSYCTAPEARLIWKAAQQSLTMGKSDWGRPISKIEQLLMELTKADAECGILSGGFVSEAFKTYNSILDRLENEWANLDSSGYFRMLVQSHCWIGLTRIALYSDFEEEEFDPTEMARKSLDALTSINPNESTTTTTMPETFFSVSLTGCFKHNLSVARQLVADALVRSGRAPEAKVFLLEAVKESPADAEAAFSLGAFLLREALQQSPGTRNQSDVNAAKIQLLKAAKLDSQSAGPFALLGIWYEESKDLKRAVGCYSKALLCDPPHPVAGRGIIRLTKWDSAKAIVDAAIQTNSAVNGWAWRALGNNKVMETGENELGAVALLKALRMRDIDRPENEAMSPFFVVTSSSSTSKQYMGKEKADSWSELAFCYRRLGRYTAAIRSYYSALEAAGEQVEASVLCACAEAELGLGLAEEAADKFNRALKMGDTSMKPIAALGQGSALLALAQRDAQDKAGSAFNYIQRGISGFDTSTKSYGCTQKLLGDLYSFGAALTPDVFISKGASNEDDSAILDQIAFVQDGEACYRAAAEHYAGVSENQDEMAILQAAMFTDAGANLLLRAQLTAFHDSKGLGFDAKRLSKEVSHLYELALAEFRRAAELCSDYAPAWCGIGCSTVFSDPLLAQHAFCRSLQLDSLSPDAYSNLGFLYTSHNSYQASRGVLDALTQVADSPMMWINRALILDRDGEATKSEENIAQAADAYRAALQVVKHPSALLGLALTCRASASGSTPKKSVALQESYGYLQQYRGQMGSCDMAASLLESICSLEEGFIGSRNKGGNDSLEGKKSFADVSKEVECLHGVSTEGGEAVLDLQLIQKCLSSAEAYSGGDGAMGTFPVSLARQIVHEPHRGDLWVAMTKSLFRNSGNSKSGLESALVGSSRAVRILSHQLTSTSQQMAVTVNDKDLSEALSLDYWLDNLRKSSNEMSSNNKVLELQKSLIINPGNRFAREALANAVANEQKQE